MSSKKKPVHGRNRTAAETTIRALEELGRIEEIDAARVSLVRTLADAVDTDPTNASLWREYRAAEQALREQHDTTGDEFAQLLAELSAEMGDTTPARTTQSRQRNRDDR
jgi:hypothetical protein